jgi:hypothetical protein
MEAPASPLCKYGFGGKRLLNEPIEDELSENVLILLFLQMRKILEVLHVTVALCMFCAED